MKCAIDMHVHSTASDGSFSPSELVELAIKAGLTAIAITDHDCTGGIDEALMAAKDTRIEVVPGIEIGVGETDDIHILGFYIDHKNPRLESMLKKLREWRELRNKAMIEKLQSAGFDITYDEVKKITGASNMGRLHIAQALEIKGQVSDYRKIFKQYISPGQAAYVKREKIGEKEGIETITASGGLAFLAHINYLQKSEEELDAIVRRLTKYGLAGIEAFYSDYTPDMERIAAGLAEKHNLLKSGGTDFHGTRRKGTFIGTGHGNMCVPYSLLEKIKQAAGICR